MSTAAPPNGRNQNNLIQAHQFLSLSDKKWKHTAFFVSVNVCVPYQGRTGS